MAIPVRFTPLEGSMPEDGIGDLVYDDGTTRFIQDPELASMVSTYQDHLPASPAAMRGSGEFGPDQRTAAITAATPGANQVVGALNAQGASMPAPAPISLAPEPVAPAAPAAASPVAASPPAPPPAPTATDLYSVAAADALQPKVIPGQAAGWSPAQRSGVLPEDVATRQAGERQQADDDVLAQTELAREVEAEETRKQGLLDYVRKQNDIDLAKREQAEALAKKARYETERREVENTRIADDLSHQGPLRNALAVLGAAMLGFTGSDAGLRMIEGAVDRHVRTQIGQRDSKLRRLAEQMGSEEQVIAAAKEQYYRALEQQAASLQQMSKGRVMSAQTPAVLAVLRQKQTDAAHAAERESLGKQTDVYQQGRAPQVVGPDYAKAAGLMQKGEGAAADAKKAEQIGKPKPEQQKALSNLRRIRDTLKRGQETGALSAVVGWQDKVPLGPPGVVSKLLGGPGTLNEVQETFGGLPPEQQEQRTALGELQVDNLMRLVREPNNIKTQNLVQSIGVPKNDSEIKAAVARLDELIALEEQGNVALPEPLEVK
jgi:hypothetical protein